MSKRFPWKGCSNLILPPYYSLLTEKRRMRSNSYKGRGRPKKTDYEYKSVLDLMFEMDEIHNKQIDNLYLRK